ncbi:hypothetical protein A9G34_10055 [Gilliamella sp. Choc4-2]|uniref:GmrSD restriction endonuclease domain-containing protein n=1 Tax=unclassified Gilliamella TaxID=2685620 RepID=UPI00080E55F0|nr:DUF262 domain-containing protein [Gilliamella apicola]OCG30533.1 hypothetical protein A9G33_07495 [Gilliamella apicola]OCG43057.1 hypothetical protein A9G34_10055 [Gilliamella apicola]
MEDSFKPRSLSISELFGDTKNLYKIPKYQRPYKWESEQVEQLWDDILESYENDVLTFYDVYHTLSARSFLHLVWLQW